MQPQIEKWKPAMQARYFRHLIDDGHAVEDVAELTNVPPATIRERLRTDLLYQLACSLDLPDETSVKVRNPRAFPLSTLERALESKAIQDFLGIVADPEKAFRGKVQRSEFQRGFSRLVSDIANKDADSRKLHDEKAVKEYLADFGDDKPDLSKRGRFALQDPIGKQSTASARDEAKSKPATPRRQSKSVIPTDLRRAEVESERIQHILKELKGITLKTHPNASAVLLRTLLELCVTNRLEKVGAMSALLQHHQNKKGKPAEWSPTLRQQMTHLLEDVDLGLQGPRLAALKRFTTDKREVLCLDALDKFVHNKYTPPSESDLRKIWTTLDPLMRILLVDPS